MLQKNAQRQCRKETKKGQMVVKGNPVSLYTEVLFASNSFINGTINLSFNITEYFCHNFPVSRLSCIRGSCICDWHANFGCHTDMLGTGWNVCARSCRSCKWSCVPITNRWSSLELGARHRVKLNLLCRTRSLGPSSSAGQGQQQSGKKAQVAWWGGMALGAHGARHVGGEVLGR